MVALRLDSVKYWVTTIHFAPLPLANISADALVRLEWTCAHDVQRIYMIMLLTETSVNRIYRELGVNQIEV